MANLAFNLKPQVIAPSTYSMDSGSYLKRSKDSNSGTVKDERTRTCVKKLDLTMTSDQSNITLVVDRMPRFLIAL